MFDPAGWRCSSHRRTTKLLGFERSGRRLFAETEPMDIEKYQSGIPSKWYLHTMWHPSTHEVGTAIPPAAAVFPVWAGTAAALERVTFFHETKNS